MLRFASLGSGSEGNGLLVEGALDDGTVSRVLLDCGFGIREAQSRLHRLGVDPATLTAIVVTHEHSDHIGGVLRLARRYEIPVYLTHGTASVVRAEERDRVQLRECVPDRPFSVGCLDVLPYPVPHDAREPVQYVFSQGDRRLGVLTDVGRPTAHIVSSLAACTALVLEANHDPAMLEASDYPYALKRRISGAFGHLANERAAELLTRLVHSRLDTVVAAHLSKQNNTPELAQAAFAAAWSVESSRISLALQGTGLDWTCA